MKLVEVQIKNFRSIRDSNNVGIEPIQALVGENNAGKSNILRAIDVFLTAGAGGVTEGDYLNPNEPIVITATFGQLDDSERKPPLRKYVLGDKIILEKQITLVQDKKKEGKRRAEAVYHGYVARPKDWWLDPDEAAEKRGKTSWKDLATEHGLLEYVTDAKGAVGKASYEAGILTYLEEHPEVEYVDPKPGETQALGLPTVLLDRLPAFHLLPAITDYSDEVDKRAGNTSFRRLMADLSERVLKADPRYNEINAALKKLSCLLNAPRENEPRDEGEARLEVLGGVEASIRDLLKKMMPQVQGLRLNVMIDEIKDLFSAGVSVWVHDGVETDVLRKGNGLQRCVVFAFLQALVMNQRGQLLPVAAGAPEEQNKPSTKTIILAVEEPELFIHPQAKRVIYSVLRGFGVNDQVIYSTHDPAFVDVSKYHQIALVRKPSTKEGTQVTQCEPGVLGDPEERKGFQFVTSFGLQQNEMFFAQKVILAEGEEDRIGIVAVGRHLKLFIELPEERGYSIIVAENKQEMPKFMRIMNAFKIPFVILHELDGNPESEASRTIRALLNGNRSVELPNNLEDACGHQGHFHKSFDAKMFFKNVNAVSQDFKDAVTRLLADG